MSYPSQSGYGSSYYNTVPSTSNAQNGYGIGRQTTQASGYSNQVAYQNDTRQQYDGIGYDWSGHNQPQHDPEERTRQPYGGEGYWDNGGQQSNYTNYQRQANDYATQAAAGNNSRRGYETSGQSSTASDVQGLNSLARASRIEAPAQPQPEARTYGSNTPLAGATQNHVRSPVTSTQSYGNLSLPAPYNSQVSQGDGGGQNLALSAAAALAGATNRRYQTAPQPIPQKSASPAMSSASSRVAEGRYRTSSPQVVTASSTHNRQPSAQSQQAYSNNVAKNYSGPDPSTYNKQGKKTGVANTASKVSRAQTQSQPAVSASHPPNSIANLVTIDNETDNYTSAGQDQSQISGYIDPTKVYDPYHMEREQRRKAAHEAEAKREADEAKAKEKAQQEKSKRKAQIAGGVREASVASTSGNESNMAAEMKLMMEKMKEFRSKDPTMFQKLWEDMRKGGSNSAAASVAVNPPPSPKPNVQPTPTTAKPVPKASTSTSKPGRSDAVRPLEIPEGIPANGYKVVVENNPGGLPDLGRFPAERRIRAAYQRQPANTTSQNAAAGPGLDSQSPTTTPVPAPSTTVEPIRIPQASLPPKSPAGGTIWPEEKRNELASHALSFLKAIPENAKVNVNSADIHAMLDQNPSYGDLCELLEKKGLRFHRAHFARHLLSNVPDLNTKSAKPESQAVNTPTVAKKVNATSIANGSPMMAGAHNALPLSASPATANGGYPPLKLEKQAGAATKARKSTTSLKPEPEPGSKEARARKRDFAELVDLTQLDDNDDYVPSAKQPRLEPPVTDTFHTFNFGGIPQAHAQGAGGYGPPPYPQSLPPGPPLGLGWGVNPSNVQPVSYTPYALAQPPREKVILAKPLNKSEALTKSYYDARTIARDVLIAAGRHPGERPLNAHLSGMLGVHIELDSDLNTFDWDAIDPGGPPAPKVAFVDIPAAPPRFKFGERVVNTTSLQNASIPKKERRQDTASAPAPTDKVRDARKPNQDFSTFAKPAQLSRTFINAGEAKVSSNTPQKRTTSFSSVELPSRDRATRSISQQQENKPSASKMDEPLFASGKRRGRPPGAKNKHPSVRHTKNPTQPGALAVEIPRRMSPPRAMISTPTKTPFKCRWRNCDAHLDNLVLLRKHVNKVHKPTQEEIEESEGFVCWWKKCSLLKLNENDEYYSEKRFPNADEWCEHWEKEHVSPIGLKYGDGPSTKPIDPQTLMQDRIRYLSDESGRGVTPDVTNSGIADLPMDTLSLISVQADEANKAAHKSFLKTHRNNRIDDKASAEETLRAMEARRTKMPGIDRQGCTLVNEERRKTFMQNPDIERIVDY